MVCCAENLHKTHMCLGQGLGVSVQLKKFKNLFCGFGLFSEIVRVTIFSEHTVVATFQYCIAEPLILCMRLVYQFHPTPVSDLDRFSTK